MWELDYKENWLLKNWYFWTAVLEKTLESPLGCKEIQPVHPKGNQSNTLATWCEELTHFKRSWYWEILKARGEGDDRGWDRWMASPTQWTWVWVNSGSWWWTGQPGMLLSMGFKESDRTEQLNWLTEVAYACGNVYICPMDWVNLSPYDVSRERKSVLCGMKFRVRDNT